MPARYNAFQGETRPVFVERSIPFDEKQQRRNFAIPLNLLEPGFYELWLVPVWEFAIDVIKVPDDYS